MTLLMGISFGFYLHLNTINPVLVYRVKRKIRQIFVVSKKKFAAIKNHLILPRIKG